MSLPAEVGSGASTKLKRPNDEVIVISDSDSDHDVNVQQETKRIKQYFGDPVGRTDKKNHTTTTNTTVHKSPISLNRLDALPADFNNDTDTLSDLIGHDSLRAMWQFNFMFSLQFIMSKVSKLARPQLKVNLVHGLDDSPGGTLQMMQYEREHAYYRENIKFIKAKMPFRFGTHHSKMMILEFADSSIQIVVHTANMIPKDWNELTQGIWKSPMLSRKKTLGGSISSGLECQFERDFIQYIGAYNLTETNHLVKILKVYDFTPIKAIFIASVPGYHGLNAAGYFDWGAGKLRHVIAGISSNKGRVNGKDELGSRPKIIAQVSSIATLGPDPKYLYSLICDLKGLDPKDGMRQQKSGILLNDFELVFPRVQDVREAIGGYDSGVSIHCFKYFSTQRKQYEYIRPLLKNWSAHRAGRQRVPPHIKTYCSYNEDTDTLNWYLLTSGNLSKQAWGSISYSPKRGGDELYIQSYECGVLLHPGLFQEDDKNENANENMAFKPVYRTNSLKTGGSEGASPRAGGQIPIRMAYDVPTTPYQGHDRPWCGHMDYAEPDNYGRSWIVN